MRYRCYLLSCCLLLFTGLAAQQFSVLLITETAGWHHPSITDGIPALERLAKRHDFKLDRYQSGMRLTAEMLARYDAIVQLSTTGDIFDDEEQAAFEAFVRSGKGWVGIHAAADTEYDWPWYTKLVGHMFKIHPAVQTAMLDVRVPGFPGLETWPRRMLWTDEWYEFGPAQSELNYLITIDESTYDPNAQWGDNVGTGMGDTHPIAWYHNYDGGRAFYTNLGHVPAVYGDDYFLRHVYGGIYWAATGRGLPE